MQKSIVVTGTSTGFGKLTVQTLAADGHLVFATMRGVNGKNKAHADELSTWAEEHHYAVEIIDMDVTDDASVEAATKVILAKTDKIDAVVNNAGVYAGGLDETFSVQDYKNIYEVNVFGVLRVVKAFLPSMRKAKSGLFIQVSSLMGRFVVPFSAVYTSSKWAVEAIAEGLHYELAPMGIDSVIIQPGAFPTEIFSKPYTPEHQAVSAEYTETLPYLQSFGQNFQEMMSGEVPNKPQHVADAIKKLIDTPVGERPLRVAVDLMMGETAQPINIIQANVQFGFLNHMGLGDLLVTKDYSLLQGA